MLKWILILALPLSLFGQTGPSIQLLTKGSIAAYEKVEIGISLPATVNQRIKNFITDKGRGEQLNPFDPEQINIRALFIGPDGDTILRNGFFYADFERNLRDNTWNHKKTEWLHRIRVAFNWPGNWRYKVFISIPSSSLTYESPEKTITCIDGDKKGPLTVREGATQLSYKESGDPFFAVGCNIANSNQIKITPKSSLLHLNWIESLGKNGGNFFRLELGGQSFLPDWESIETYQSKLDELWELDQIFDLAEDQNMYMIIFRHHVELAKGAGWETTRWENNPYRKALGFESRKEYFTDSTAIHLQNRMHHYLEARYGYSPNWTFYGYSEMDIMLEDLVEEEHLSMQEASQIFKPWFIAQKQLFRDSLHNQNLLFLNTYAVMHDYEIRREGINQLGDAIGFHKYGQDIEINSGTRWGRQGILDRFRRAYPGVPVFAEEVGTANQPDFIRLYCASGRLFHATIWSTSMMDLAGSGLHWWWDLGIFDKNYQTHYQPLSDFVQYLPEDPVYRSSHKGDVELYAQVRGDGKSGVGWVNNSTYHWSYEYLVDSALNELITKGYMEDHCVLETGLLLGQKEGSNGNFLDEARKENPKNLKPRKMTESDDFRVYRVKASHLFKKSYYEVTWYSVAGEKLREVKRETVKSNALGAIKLNFPESETTGQQDSDYAFRLVLKD